MRNKHNDILYNIIADDTAAQRASAEKSTSSSSSKPTATNIDDEIEIVEAKVEGDLDDTTYSIVDFEDADAVEPVTAKIEAADQQTVDELLEPLDDEVLTGKVGELLKMLVDDSILKTLGWPHQAKCVDVLDEVLRQCGQEPVDDGVCADYGQKLRENAKLLFTTVIDNESIRELLNNHSVDEVILHVLKLMP